MLINAPIRKTLGVWVLGINYSKLQNTVLLMLIKKPTPLSGKEISFIRHYLNLTTCEFSKFFDVSHVSILNWESRKRKMDLNAEIVLRLRILDHLKISDKEFRKNYLFYTSNIIAKLRDENSRLEIDAKKIVC